MKNLIYIQDKIWHKFFKKFDRQKLVYCKKIDLSNLLMMLGFFNNLLFDVYQ